MLSTPEAISEPEMHKNNPERFRIYVLSYLVHYQSLRDFVK